MASRNSTTTPKPAESAPAAPAEEPTTPPAETAPAAETTSTESAATEAPATDAPAADVPATTTLDTSVTKPSTTAPGDGPADTTDPTERAVSVPPTPGAEAIKVGTVNAVKPAPKVSTPKGAKAKERTETYDAVKPDGTTVKVTRNIETGETSVS